MVSNGDHGLGGWFPTFHQIRPDAANSITMVLINQAKSVVP